MSKITQKVVKWTLKLNLSGITVSIKTCGQIDGIPQTKVLLRVTCYSLLTFGIKFNTYSRRRSAIKSGDNFSKNVAITSSDDAPLLG